jgi:glycine cleavage system H lipoate-binding protein
MSTITFDTLKFVHKLKSVGIPENQAEAITEAFKEASGEAELATHRDIERLESRIVEFRAEISGKVTEVNGRLTLLQWMLALVVAAEVAPLLTGLFK